MSKNVVFGIVIFLLVIVLIFASYLESQRVRQEIKNEIKKDCINSEEYTEEVCRKTIDDYWQEKNWN